jgi:hypothetical protein
MLIQKICGFILLFLGLGQTLFAEKLFNYTIRSNSAKIMHFDRWPAWMFPTSIWMIRFGGILIIIGGILLIIKNWK